MFDWMKKKNDFPVDLVVLWCDGRDPSFSSSKNYWALKEGKETDIANHASRFIENDELRYVFRSVEKNAHWIRYIWLVTNGQIPQWLEQTHPKIRLVTHEDILPPHALPTFNSVAIESSLHRINGLSEHFLYANDDMFVWRPIQKSLFFPRFNYVYNYYNADYVWPTHMDMHESQVYTAYQLVQKFFPKSKQFLTSFHNIDGYLKSSFERAWQLFPTQLADTQRHKFRQRTDVQRWIFSAVAAMQHQATWKANIRRPLLGDIGGYYGLTEQYEEKIAHRKPYLVCLNDHEKCSDNDRYRLRAFLKYSFPCPCSFEK